MISMFLLRLAWLQSMTRWSSLPIDVGMDSNAKPSMRLHAFIQQPIIPVDQRRVLFDIMTVIQTMLTHSKQSSWSMPCAIEQPCQSIVGYLDMCLQCAPFMLAFEDCC